MRRLYEVMRNSAAMLVLWLCVLLVLSLTEMQSDSFSSNIFQTYTFVVLQLPLHGLVLFGSYALCSIGYHLMVLGKYLAASPSCTNPSCQPFIEDCNEAEQELKRQIVEAKADLKKRGVRL